MKMAEDDFVALAAGKLNAMQAFMKGKLKISGNMMLAQKLQGVFEAAKKAAPAPSKAPSKVARIDGGDSCDTTLIVSSLGAVG